MSWQSWLSLSDFPVLGCPVLAVLLWLSCPSSSVLTAPFWLSHPGCPVLVFRSACPFLAVFSFLSSPGCHILAVLSWPSWPGSPVLAVLSWLFCPACPIPATSLWLSCSSWCSGRPVLAVLFWLSCSGCPFLSVLAFLIYPGYLTLAALLWQPYPGSPVMAVLFSLSFSTCPIVTVLSLCPLCTFCPLMAVIPWLSTALPWQPCHNKYKIFHNYRKIGIIAATQSIPTWSSKCSKAPWGVVLGERTTKRSEQNDLKTTSFWSLVIQKL